MKPDVKEKIKNWLLVIMISALVGSFLLFFLGYYRTGLAVGAVFMFLSLFLGQWYSAKRVDDLYHSEYKRNKR
ncbi:putative membrane protein [Anoxybacillus sp. B7M1]|jgi:hypothetical protein|uniref:Uncharacterized protein n=1 Tax=Anoxybacteroides rupiense TaxID=311460 RepID=A0ABD5IXR5_9BACL|nr:MULTISPECIES: hypothetical protein [Anoxybacillus]ANB57234.1 putative membrane protein [Anoxybacillus sp. B2M1]ANB65230.1 putative membrane protein [Anoxybacillus sp. B7M1]KXG10933.1 hypothetical protein AT864_00801 [Anoxybacillus sp. P3H1B]MBB3907889.1 hypothetical protein [Anoxybacillus rupiensis]MBS2772523.1 hypothetical protein [Anoxybacillus rupiensis]